MRVFVLSFLLYFAQHCDSSAIKCGPGLESCATEQIKDPPIEIVRDDAALGSVQCAAGTEWESNCHLCRCSAAGVADCRKQSTCDAGTFADPIQCKPKSSFQRDCNTCVCLENGLALCTVKACSRSMVPKKSDLVLGKECYPGSSWKSGCNRCTCNADGEAICSDEQCTGLETDPVMRCGPNTMWRNDCNTCWCTSDGKPMCTRIGCIGFDKDGEEKPKEIDQPEFYKETTNKIKREAPCKANEEFKSDCNDCKCSSTGQSYTCTQNECLEGDKTTDVEVFMEPEGVDHIEKHSVCKPKEDFYINCNICHCNADGTDYSCADKPCPLPADVEVFHELKDVKPIMPITEDDSGLELLQGTIM